MSRKGLGAMLAFLGIGSFALPLFGLQFRLLNLFGNARPVISIILLLVGVFFLFSKEN